MLNSKIQNQVEWPVHKTVMNNLSRAAMDLLGSSICTPLYLNVGRAMDVPTYEELREQLAEKTKR